jgi:precorrin-4 methylase
MGMDTPSSRIELALSSNMGEIEKISNIVNNMGLTIISIVSAISREKSDTRTTVIRVNTGDVTDLCKAFEEAGYQFTTEYKVNK